MGRYLVRFDQLKVGAYFSKNGNKCYKRSTMTAELLDYNRIFYYRKAELVEITDKKYLNHPA